MSTEVPKAVMAEELWRESVPVADAWMGRLRDAREISRLLGRISKTMPPMSHLKRCSEKRLLLGFAAPPPPSSSSSSSSSLNDIRGRMSQSNELNVFTREEIERLLREADVDLTLFENGAIEIVQVPAVSARTKRQAKRAAEIWPINFHPDLHLESILNATCFDKRQIEAIDRCTKVCIEVALLGQARGTKECHGGAVVYDPKTNNIVAVAASRIDLHPLWHSAIVAIDLVARLGSGGAYDFSEYCRPEGNKCPRIEHDGQTWPLAFPQELQTIARRFSYDGKSPPVYTYLCTDFWVFLLMEPCALCAMALLHSRVSNIFYGVANSHGGVLGSRTLLNDLPGLNHRYGVWKSVRTTECLAALLEIQRNDVVNQ